MSPHTHTHTPAAQVFDNCCDTQSMTFQRSLDVADLYVKALKPSWMSLKFSRELDNQVRGAEPRSPDWRVCPDSGKWVGSAFRLSAKCKGRERLCFSEALNLVQLTVRSAFRGFR